jgi:hypothetical protein
MNLNKWDSRYLYTDKIWLQEVFATAKQIVANAKSAVFWLVMLAWSSSAAMAQSSPDLPENVRVAVEKFCANPSINEVEINTKNWVVKLRQFLWNTEIIMKDWKKIIYNADECRVLSIVGETADPDETFPPNLKDSHTSTPLIPKKNPLHHVSTSFSHWPLWSSLLTSINLKFSSDINGILWVELWEKVRQYILGLVIKNGNWELTLFWKVLKANQTFKFSSWNENVDLEQYTVWGKYSINFDWELLDKIYISSDFTKAESVKLSSLRKVISNTSFEIVTEIIDRNIAWGSSTNVATWAVLKIWEKWKLWAEIWYNNRVFDTVFTPANRQQHMFWNMWYSHDLWDGNSVSAFIWLWGNYNWWSIVSKIWGQYNLELDRWAILSFWASMIPWVHNSWNFWVWLSIPFWWNNLSNFNGKNWWTLNLWWDYRWDIISHALVPLHTSEERISIEIDKKPQAEEKPVEETPDKIPTAKEITLSTSMNTPISWIDVTSNQKSEKWVIPTLVSVENISWWEFTIVNWKINFNPTTGFTWPSKWKYRLSYNWQTTEANITVDVKNIPLTVPNQFTINNLVDQTIWNIVYTNEITVSWINQPILASTNIWTLVVNWVDTWKTSETIKNWDKVKIKITVKTWTENWVLKIWTRSAEFIVSASTPNNLDPTASVTTPSTTINVWQTVTISWTWIDTDGTILKYKWTDQNWTIVSTDQNYTFTWTNPWIYTFNLRVQDNNWAWSTNTASATVTVNEPVVVPPTYVWWTVEFNWWEEWRPKTINISWWFQNVSDIWSLTITWWKYKNNYFEITLNNWFLTLTPIGMQLDPNNSFTFTITVQTAEWKKIQLDIKVFNFNN